MFRVNSLRVFLCWHQHTRICIWYGPPPDPTVKCSIPSNAENSYSFQLGTNLLAYHNLVLLALASAAEHFNQFYLALCLQGHILSGLQLYQLMEDLLLQQPVLWSVAIISEDKLCRLCGDLDWTDRMWRINTWCTKLVLHSPSCALLLLNKTRTFMKSTARNQISSSKLMNSEKDILSCPAGSPTEGSFISTKSLQARPFMWFS